MSNVRPQLKVLIVDDSELNREMLGSMLEDEYEVVETENGTQVVDILRENASNLSLILLDIQMPQMDGFEVLIYMNRFHWIDTLPVIMISSKISPKFIERAYELGAADYIAHPYNTAIVCRRAADVILSFAKQRQMLEIITHQISKKEKGNRFVFSIPSHIVEFRSGESGLRVLYINLITSLLLRQLTLKTDRSKTTDEDISLMSMTSALHDIGKIAIPEEILNKPGRLTAEGFRVVQGHSMTGASLLMDLSIDWNEPLLKAAYEICRQHRERYDDRDYPDGLKGDAIPLSAQVIALTDAYDTLTNERCYEPAYFHDAAVGMILDGQCGALQPLLLECLRDIGDMLGQELTVQNMLEAENTPKETNHIMEQLRHYGLGDSERLPRQHSYEQQHFRFLLDRTGEIFFNYTVEPSILCFNQYGVGQLSIGNDLFQPLENGSLLRCIDKDVLNRITEKIQEATPAQPEFQMDIPLTIKRENQWFHCIFHVVWTNENVKHYADVMGKLRKMDQSHMTDAERTTTAIRPPIGLLLDCIRMKKRMGFCSLSDREANTLLQYLRTFFDIVRLVDVSNNCQLENGIAANSMSGKKNLTKIGLIDQNVYHVQSAYIKVDGYPCLLELIGQTTEETLPRGYGKDEVVKCITARDCERYVDILTGIYNRRHYEEQSRDKCNTSAAAMMDMDYFKTISDAYGHPIGSQVLKRAVIAIKNCIRRTSSVVWFGGDGFFVVFGGIPFHILQEKLREIRSCVNKAVISDYPQLKLSISVDGAYRPGQVSDLMEATDRLLFRVKREKSGSKIKEKMNKRL